MGMAREETRGGRSGSAARGEPVAAVAISVSAAYDEHGDAVRRFLVRFTRDAAAAEDLLHEAFIRLLTETTDGRAPASLRSWLFRVAANLAFSRARHESVASRHAGRLLGRGAAPSPEELILEREASHRLTGVLDALPADARTALLLAAHGYSGAEIARAIGRSELATRSLICRQRSRLRAAAAA